MLAVTAVDARTSVVDVEMARESGRSLSLLYMKVYTKRSENRKKKALKYHDRHRAPAKVKRFMRS
jgi:hypothetical protein